MEKILVLVLCLFCSFCVHSEQIEQPLTLGHFLTDVMQNNPQLLANEQRIQSAQQRVKPAAALDDPFIAFGVDEVPFGERQYNTKRYQLSQAIPFPGKRHNKADIAQSDVKLTETDGHILRRQLTVFATQAYYKALYNDQALTRNNELIALVESLLGSAKTRYQTGGNEHHDWLLSKIERSALDIERHNLIRQQATLYRALSELTGYTINYAHGSLSFDFTAANKDSELATLTEQPELNALQTQIQRAHTQYHLAKLGYYPDFVVQAMAMTSEDDMNKTMSQWGLMIGMTLPLYANNKQSQLISAARHEQNALELEQLTLLNRLKNEQFDAQQQLMSALDRVKLYEESVIPQTDMAVTNAQSAYASRKLGLSQYLNVLKVRQTQTLELLAARIDVELALLRQRELLSMPPILRLAPSKPSLFNGGGMDNSMNNDMNDSMTPSSAVSIGRAMVTPQKTRSGTSSNAGSSSGMSGM